jgi:hypothetical protein
VSDRPQGTSTASPLTSGNTRLSRGQGVIPEQDHKEQAQSYRNIESAADMAASAGKKAAVGAEWGAALKFGDAIGTLF